MNAKLIELYDEIKNLWIKDYQHRISRENLTKEELNELNEKYIEYWKSMIFSNK